MSPQGSTDRCRIAVLRSRGQAEAAALNLCNHTAHPANEQNGARLGFDCVVFHPRDLIAMTGRSRLPGGEPRKASQKRTRRAGTIATRLTPQWRMGDRVAWGGRVGSFLRDLNDGTHAEIRIEQRTYRVRIADLRSG
jgi:hypothetical protein